MVTWRGTEDGFVTDSVREIYLRYALGRPGMIVLEATGIRDVASGPLLRLSHDRFVPGLRSLVSEMKAVSPSAVVPQIIDFLKIARRKPTRAFMEAAVAQGRLDESVLDLTDEAFEDRAELYLKDPRDLRNFEHGYRQTIEDLSLDEVRSIPGFFARAAVRAKAAGFDGVELHFAHAYTVASFLSVTNGRRDAYGGSLENRLRLPREIVEEVRGAVGWGFVVGCRYLGSEDILLKDGSIGGNTIEDAVAIGLALSEGLDFLSVSRGGKFEDARKPAVGETAYPYTGHSGQRCIPRQKGDPPGVNLHLASTIRRALRAAGRETPVVTAGKISRLDQAEAILERGDADLVGMARALLADPDLPRKWSAGRGDLVRECVYCPFCEEEDQHHRVVTCTLWPKLPGSPRGRQTPGVFRESTASDDSVVFGLPPKTP
jgi:2,4-dienoyl-CoA reductase-like NADH-dependent reductase (Old Yellow Enzyme family)